MVPAQSPAVIGVVLNRAAFLPIYPVGLALLGQRFKAATYARANTAFSMLPSWAADRPPLTGRRWTRSAIGLGWTLALFYSIAAVAALLAFHRRG
jgi:hypothetical protein